MATTPEGSVKKLIDDYLKTLPNCLYYKPVSIGMGVHGIPDYIGCYRGQFFAIEAKAPGKKPSALQVRQITLIEGAWGHVVVVDGPARLGLFKDWVGTVDAQ